MLKNSTAKEEIALQQVPGLQIFIFHIFSIWVQNRSVRHKNACFNLDTYT